jgi:hypothetical protein
MRLQKLVRADQGPLWVELFAVGNLAFLALDVYIAHLANHFEHASEWIPIVFSAVAPLLLVPGLVRRRPVGRWSKASGLVVGSVAIAVGIGGLALHLQSAFFLTVTLESLVYTAPFIAPLSYTGIGLLLVLNRLESRDPVAHGSWVVCLALGGFVGNFGLSLADHAINGFFYRAEWIPVFSAALASGLLLVLWRRPGDRILRGTTQGVLFGQIVVGLLGAWFHARSIPSDAWLRFDALAQLAPPFAPLLFADLAVLALIG